MFVIEIGVLCPYNSKKIMQIHDNILIAECSSYDFKEMLERKKVKSWLKSVSAFANTDGGSLFYGVNDDGMIVGLENPQADADFISEMPNYRLNLPDYSDRAIFEGLVNHLIHRDYTVMGGEVHIDIYDDRVELVSPGAMLDGTQIQDRDIYKVPSMRRNPVIADMFTQLDYMEKRGSGLRKMRELTEKLPNFLPGKEPQYQTEAISFYTTFYNLNWGENGRIPVEEVANRVNSTLERYPVKQNLNKPVGRTAQRIIDMVISNPMITREKMAEELGISLEGVKKQIKNLKDRGILIHEGSDKTGYWRIIIKP